MIRTQIYLNKEQYEDVKLRARLAGKSSAEVIRSLIDDGLSPATTTKINKLKLSDLSKLNITGGPKDLSRNLDEYLYER